LPSSPSAISCISSLYTSPIRHFSAGGGEIAKKKKPDKFTESDKLIKPGIGATRGSVNLDEGIGGIDEDLLSRQEDPTVTRQKQELLRAFTAQLKKLLEKSNTEQHASHTHLKFFLKRIYGCSAYEIKTWCALFGLHEQTTLDKVPNLFWAVLILQLNKQPRFGAENILIEAQAIRRMIQRRTWKGLRHLRCLPVSTKRTKGHRTQRKLGGVRARRLGYPIRKMVPKGCKKKK
jgi:ribosomal protein S13